MGETGEITDILVLGFLRDGLAKRNRDLVEQQKKIAMILLACRHDQIARKRAYHAFLMLEKAISHDYREPIFSYNQSLCQGQAYVAQNKAKLKYGSRYPRLSHKVFDYLKWRILGNRERR